MVKLLNFDFEGSVCPERNLKTVFLPLIFLSTNIFTELLATTASLNVDAVLRMFVD